MESDRVNSGDVIKEQYNIARTQTALTALLGTQQQRMEKIKKMEERNKEKGKESQVKKDELELHRLRRSVVCLEFLLGIQERFPDLSDRHRLPTHVENSVCYYRKKYGSVIVGRRLAHTRQPLHGISKRRLELQKQIRKWKDEPQRNVSYQACPSEMRILVGSDRLHDIDQINSFPTIAIFMAKLYGLESRALETYVSSDREEILKQVQEIYSVNRKVAKTLFITILHGGDIDGWKAKNKIRVVKNMQLVENMETEAKAIRVAALQSTLPLEQSVLQARDYLINVKKKSNDGEFGSTKCDRSLFSLMMQTREDRILDVMMNFCKEKGVLVESLQFDGLLVTCPPRFDLRQFLNELETTIENKTDIPMKLTEKDLFRKPHQAIIDELARV
jgi:hypothetical protein